MTEAALKAVPAYRPEEAELVARARRGDHDAYAQLVREHEEIVFRVAYLIVRSAADAEDVAQEAFVKAYRALGRFRAGSPFRPWLLRIVGNEARNHRRAAGRRAYHQQRVALLEPVTSSPAPDDEVQERESRRRLLAALDRLPEGERAALAGRYLAGLTDAETAGEGERAALAGRYLAGLTDAETAAALGIPRATVKMRAWRGLNRLRGELGEELR